MTAKELIRSRSLRFLHPDVVSSSNEENITSILKAVGYFRNFTIFKNLYTLLYKSKYISLEQYKSIYAQLIDYKVHHPNDFFIDGFNLALNKSQTVKPEIKMVYSVMMYDHLCEGSLFDNYSNRTSKRLSKAVAAYYNNDKSINLAIIKKSKVMKVNNDNLIKNVIVISKSF